MHVEGSKLQLKYPTMELLHNTWGRSVYMRPSPFLQTGLTGKEDFVTIVLIYDSYGQTSDSEDDTDVSEGESQVAGCVQCFFTSTGSSHLQP